jgi:ankyrin repeat protein
MPASQDDPLFDAIHGHDALGSLQRLVSSGVSPLSSRRELFAAATLYEQHEVIRFLIAHGLTLKIDHTKEPFTARAEGPNRETALHEAASKGLNDILRTLLTIDGKDYLDTFDVILYYTPLHYAAQDGREETVRILLEAGANPNANDEAHIGKTPLESAIEARSLPIVNLLLEAGADPDIPTWVGLTARDRARKAKGHSPEIWEAISAMPAKPHLPPNGE